MIYLFLCILSSTFILLLFKHLDNRGIDSFQTIVVNYFTATVLGAIISHDKLKYIGQIQLEELKYALLLGLLFIIVFFLIARSTRYAGVSTTSVATKMSAVIPAAFSLIKYNEEMNWLKIVGIATGLVALFLTIHKKEAREKRTQAWFLPILIFIGTGIVDTIVKYSQAEHIQVGGIGLYNTIVFGTSLVIGIIVIAFTLKRQIRVFKPQVIWGGILLGLANFGSLYFLIAALSKSGLESSVVFPLNNIGVVVLSVIFAIVLYREKLSKINLAGILIAMISVILMLGY